MVNPQDRATAGFDDQPGLASVVERDDATHENARKATGHGENTLDGLLVSRESRERRSGCEVRETGDEETTGGLARVASQSDAGNDDLGRGIVSFQRLPQLAEPLVEEVSGERPVRRDRHPVEVRGYVFPIERLDPVGLPGPSIPFDQERVRPDRTYLNRRELYQVGVGLYLGPRGIAIRAPEDEPPNLARVPFRHRENVASPGLPRFRGTRHPSERQQ